MNETPVLEKQFYIPSYLVDCNSLLRIDALFMLFQEMSDEHAALFNSGWHELRERGYFWVITKILIKIERLPSWQETITIRSWVKASDAATSPRHYQIIDSEGNIIVSGNSIWAILDINNGKPQRMSDFDQNFLPQDLDAAPKPRRIPAFHLDLSNSPVKSATLSDLDFNKHVNNAHYIQWAIDSVSEGFYNSHKIVELNVNFLAQARFNDKYAVVYNQNADNEFVTSIVSAEDSKEFCRISSVWQPIS